MRGSNRSRPTRMAAEHRPAPTIARLALAALALAGVMPGLALAMQDEPPVVLVGADDSTVGKRDAHLVDRGAARLVHWDVEAEARGEPTG